MVIEICPVCNSRLSHGYCSWHFVCDNCAYESSNFQQTINSNTTAHALIDEGAREKGLHRLRLKNFEKILESITALQSNGGSLLEVGCAHGWFLEAAKKYFEVLGIEPDQNVYNASIHRHLPVRRGYFPDALNESEKFDIIVFNDVLEHLPDIKNTFESCLQHLNKGGLLVLNLPSSNGVFYRLSKIFCRFGGHYFFDRLWQKGLPSPHLHYFNQQNLACLLKQNNFNVESKGSLSTLGLSGLYARISYSGDTNIIIRILTYIFIALILPILKVLPNDIIYVVAKQSKRHDNHEN